MPFNQSKEKINILKNNTPINFNENVNFDTSVSNSLAYLITENNSLSVTNITLSLEGSPPELPPNTDDLLEGSTNLYFTDERAQDAIGSILTDSSTIDFTYNDSTPSITASVIPSGININNLSNTLSISKGGTGLTSTPSNGQLLIGNGTGYTLSTLTAGYGLTANYDSGILDISSTSNLSPYFKDDGDNPIIPPVVTGDKSIAIGDGSTASGNNSFAIGSKSIIPQTYMTFSTDCSGDNSFLIGSIRNSEILPGSIIRNNTMSISGDNSFLIGNVNFPSSSTSRNLTLSSDNTVLFRTGNFNTVSNNNYINCNKSIFINNTVNVPLEKTVYISALNAPSFIRTSYDSSQNFPGISNIYNLSVSSGQSLYLTSNLIDTNFSSLFKKQTGFLIGMGSSGDSSTEIGSFYLHAATTTGTTSNSTNTITWTLPQYTNSLFDFFIVAKLPDSSLGAAFRIKGSYKKGLSANNGAFLIAPTKTIIARSNTTFDANLTITTGLILTVTYTSSDPCCWYITNFMNTQKEFF